MTQPNQKTTTPTLRPRSERGLFHAHRLQYGQSVMGAPLLYFPADVQDEHTGIVMAGTHGDEVAAVVTLSCALRSLQAGQLRHHVILAVNPDGCQLGTRSNAHGVDLNRNFPTINWKAGGTVYRWNSAAESRDVHLSTGDRAGSEPETQALCRLVKELEPAWMVSIHEPLACVEDPIQSPLGHWLAERMELPLVSDLGYQTPGSFGTWCAEQQHPCITLEYPPISADVASEQYLEVTTQLLRYIP
ncbi:murein tripeptide amidase MpaA [Microbulbifer hydrolyticus]|uniref:Murein peptide amidase A n=1 Tax=Microbulbifer hydrolyticus TaxID=48074 RepID=A0A6P1TCV0_9GAMM|nr:murein tripeptide amidase MpaA [Microbulbifer hydrolyticus]MBB5209989.1 protein MpaA [Microbulbifer hydrolyticus]QHQ39483.1 murein tripeptide amidase MpaA [Microbulbifer hydrolyticus]